MKQDFGTATFEGKTYTLDCVAYLTNNVFLGWFGDAAEGESYTAEYEATAHDTDGTNYGIRWQFETVKGQEPEDESDYPFDDQHITAAIER